MMGALAGGKQVGPGRRSPAEAMTTVFALRNSRMPAAESSRP